MANRQCLEVISEPECPVCGTAMSLASVRPIRFSNGHSNTVMNFVCQECHVQTERRLKGQEQSCADMAPQY